MPFCWRGPGRREGGRGRGRGRPRWDDRPTSAVAARETTPAAALPHARAGGKGNRPTDHPVAKKGRDDKGGSCGQPQSNPPTHLSARHRRVPEAAAAEQDGVFGQQAERYMNMGGVRVKVKGRGDGSREAVHGAAPPRPRPRLRPLLRPPSTLLSCERPCRKGRGLLSPRPPPLTPIGGRTSASSAGQGASYTKGRRGRGANGPQASDLPLPPPLQYLEHPGGSFVDR